MENFLFCALSGLLRCAVFTNSHIQSVTKAQKAKICRILGKMANKNCRGRI